MKSMTRILILSAVVALAFGLVQAQVTGEPFQARSRNHDSAGSGNIFACPTTGNFGSPPCGIAYRYYSPEAVSNGNVNANADGNPIFQTTAKGSYLTDNDNSSNYFGASHPANLQMNCIWDAELRGGTGDHAGMYMAQSQLIVQNGEVGNITRADCVGTAGIACFSVGSGVNGGDPTDTPQGTIIREGGQRGVPVPVVSGGNPNVDVTLSWPDATNEYTIDGAAGPIVGVNLYVLESTTLLNSRAVTEADLTAGAVFLRSVPKGTTTTTVNFAADLTAGTQSFIPAIRVQYQDNAGTGAMESPWSANGPTVRTDPGLFTEVVNFKAVSLGKTRGQQLGEISWETTVEDGTIGFNLLRGTSLNGPFEKVANVPAQGVGGEGAAYVVNDAFKTVGNVREVFYLLAVIESDGSDNDHGPVRMELAKGPKGPKAGLGNQ